MKERIIYYLLKDKNKSFRYTEFMLEKLNQCPAKVITVILNETDCVNYDYIRNIIETDKQDFFEYEEVLFISDDFLGPFSDLNNFFENMKETECYSISERENNIPDFNLFCLKTGMIKNMGFDVGVIAKQCRYLLKQNNIRNIYHQTVQGILPFIPKGIIIKDYEETLESNSGEYLRKLYDYIKKSEKYDISCIWEYLLKNYNMADIVYNFQLVKIFSDKQSQNRKAEQKAALVLHIYYEDLIEECYKYALNMGADCDVYVTTDTEQKLNAVNRVFRRGGFAKYEGILIQNRGRDISALLVGTKSFIMNYDIVCFAHDKKVKQLKDEQTGISFADRCYENILGSKEYVENVIEYFNENEQIGMAFPPPPNHGEYYPTLGYFDWGENYDNVKKLYDKFNFEIDISKEKEVIAPLGTMFWFRPKALKNLFDIDWQYEDFPAEPNANDGTLLHAIERIYPFCVQEMGYYVCWIMNETYAGTEVNNLYYMIKSLNKKVFDKYGAGTHKEILLKIVSKEDEKLLKQAEEYLKLAEYYKEKADANERAASENMKVANYYKTKSDSAEKTLENTQKMLAETSRGKEQSEEKLRNAEQINIALTNEINNMRGTKIWRFRNLVRKILHKK